MKVQQFLYFLFFVGFFPLFSFQQELNATEYSLDNALQSSCVYNLHQDNNGVIWMGTGKGVCRYDGYEFKTYEQKDGIPGLDILRFFPQENGDIWGACYNGKLFHFNENFDGFHTYVYNDSFIKNVRGNAQVKSLVVDDLGTFHIGGFGIPPFFNITKNGEVSYVKENPDSLSFGYYCLAGDRFMMAKMMSPLIKSTSFIQSIRHSVHLGAIHLNDSIDLFLSPTGIVIKKENERLQIKDSKTAIMIKKIDDQTFAVGYYLGGVKFFNLKGEVQAHFMKKKSISDMLIDHTGDYWFSTLAKGVQYVRGMDVRLEIEEKGINDLAQDKHGNLLIGCVDGDIYKREKGVLKKFYSGMNKVMKLGAFFLGDIQTDSIIYFSQGFVLNENAEVIECPHYKKKLPEYILEKQDTFCYPTWPFNIEDADLFIKAGVVNDCIEYESSLLFATLSAKLFFYNKDTLIDLTNYSPLLSCRIDDIDIPFGQKKIFFATQGAGLVIYDKRIYNIDENKGLCSDHINEVYIENDSSIWVGSNKGLSWIRFKNKVEYEIHSLDKSDGLMEANVTDIAVVDDTVWVGAVQGLYYFPKSVLLNKSNPELFFNLTAVKSKGEYLQDGDGISYKENIISFYLNAISYDQNDKLTYHYRIKEFENDWRTSKNREIVFQSLPHGEYTFQAKAELEGHFSPKLVQFRFSIFPPFWKTWWFYLLCFLQIGGIIYFFFKIRVFNYNRDVVRELLRFFLKKIKKEEHYFVVRESGEDVKIKSELVLYVKSAGNYIELITEDDKHLIRGNISSFIERTSDPLEYLRIHRSYVIRIDQVNKKGKNWVVIGDSKIPVGESYLDQLKKIQFE